MTANQQVVSLMGIGKAYSGLVALKQVDFSINPGEIRALMGKNGAGKSTLVKLLSGAIQPDSGRVEVGGQPVAFASPQEAISAGIATVHQELTVIPGLSVAENITLGNWPIRGGLLDGRRAKEIAREALSLLGESIDPDQPAGELSIAKQQIVEIARALALKPRVLILDEPTSSLPAHEVGALLELVRRLGRSGVAVIYVSHRMDEIARVANSVSVLRDGMLIETLPIAEAPVARIAELMVGGDAALPERHGVPPRGRETALNVVDLDAGPRVRSISMQLRQGEIVGIAGLLGSGRTELMRVLAGIDGRQSGTIRVNGKAPTNHSVRSMLSHGMALVPEDRKGEGAVLGMAIEQNLSMSAMRRVSVGGIFRRDREAGMAHQSRTTLNIKADDLEAPVESLSGGNQQKVVIGRCLNAEASVLLLDEPTRGVDVLAKQQIYDLVRSFAAQGKAVIFVSSEYEELLLVCHRIMVMADGRFVEELNAEGLGMEGLMTRLLAANKSAAGEGAVP